jgi:transcriptional regulator with XRE-family HTH domain
MSQPNDCIRKVRVSYGLTQEEMADKMGVQRSTYGRFERGEISLFSNSFKRFLAALDLRPEAVIGIDEPATLNDTTLSDRIDELSEEIARLRRIIEMLAGKIEKLPTPEK